MLAFGDSITARDGLPTGYVPLLAATLGIGYTNYAVSGACMLGTADGRSSILAQMLGVSPPTRYTLCVMIVGTNDSGLYGTDAGHLASFQDGLTTGLLHLTSRKRIPEPKNEYERRLLAAGKLPSVPAGATVWVGNMPRQSAGHWAGSSSSTSWAAYQAAAAAAVATLTSQGRDVHLLDMTTVYDPDTQGVDPPANVHPGDAGHIGIKNAFHTAMLT